MLTFQFIVEAGLQELIETCGLDGAVQVELGRFETFYGQFIVHFLRGESEEMSEKLRMLPDLFAMHPQKEALEIACRMRQQIRNRVFDQDLAQKAREMVDRNELWAGELSILLATSATLSNDYEKAVLHYKESADAFQRQGCIRKSLRARMNVLVCESHLHPTRNFFARYHDLYKQAMRKPHRELIVATTCLLNISREYQNAGAPMAALKYCNHALSLFEQQMGELNYFLTLAHRAHLFCELGRREEARIDYETAKLGRFKEVEAALKVVESFLNMDTGAPPSGALENDENLIPTWKERTKPTQKAVRLSALEEKLVRCLAKGPQQRVDLMETIYGPLLDHETKLNRFKSLLGTLRKKFPQLIICENGQYRLADEILLPSTLNLKSESKFSSKSKSKNVTDIA